ncbi:MAG: hypothetical protein KC766_40440 [Myxococcales bacterium]|nr:hypothetical protein [Myxococcales bacterium]
MKTGWACLIAAMLLASSGFAEPSAGRRSSVVVQVVGQGLPSLEPSLRESLGRLALGVELARGGAESVAPSDRAAVAWVRIDVSDSGVGLLVVDARAGRVLEQRRLGSASEAVLEEQLTLLIRSALETGLGLVPERPAAIESFAAVPSSPPEASGENGQTTQAAAPVAAAQPAAPAVPDSGPRARDEPGFGVLGTWAPRDATAPHGDAERSRERGWALGVEPGIAVRWWSPDLPGRQVTSLSVAARQREFVGSPGVQAGFGYYADGQRDTVSLNFDVETREVWAMAGVSLLERRVLEWQLASGPTLLWSTANVRFAAPDYVTSEPGTHWDLVWRTQTSLRWWVQEHLALGVDAALDYDASPAGYGISEAGAERTLVREGGLRPAVGVSFGAEFGGRR